MLLLTVLGRIVSASDADWQWLIPCRPTIRSQASNTELSHCYCKPCCSLTFTSVSGFKVLPGQQPPWSSHSIRPSSDVASADYSAAAVPCAAVACTCRPSTMWTLLLTSGTTSTPSFGSTCCPAVMHWATWRAQAQTCASEQGASQRYTGRGCSVVRVWVALKHNG